MHSVCIPEDGEFEKERKRAGSGVATDRSRRWRRWRKVEEVEEVGVVNERWMQRRRSGEVEGKGGRAVEAFV